MIREFRILLSLAFGCIISVGNAVPNVRVIWENPPVSSTKGCVTGLQSSLDSSNWVEVALLPYATTVSVVLTNHARGEFYRAFNRSLTGELSQPLNVRAELAPDLQESLNTSLYALYQGKNTNQWQWLPGATNCWVNPVDLSGVSLYLYPAYDPNVFAPGDLMLITPRHGVSAAHIFGAPINKKVIFAATRGPNPTYHTNLIVAVSGVSIDVVVVTLASNVPPSIKPFSVLPADYARYFRPNTNAFVGTQAAWYRNNSRKMNVVATWTGETGSYLFEEARLPYETTPFREGSATSGDSSGPVFFVLNGKPVLAFCVYYASPAGPFLSDRIPWLNQQTGGNLSIVDLSKYQVYGQ